jgi:4-hydroxy-3-polyprenylbenzoate decarboxylase
VKRVVIAMTGASGALLGVQALRVAREREDIETHLIVSRAGLQTLHHETDMTYGELTELADVVHNRDDLASPLASGSFRTDAMIVAPCSVTTLSAIANSYDANLVVRAADVMLKERRPVVLLFRETPLHLGHIRLMEQVTLSGGIIMPPLPAFYLRPVTVEEVVAQTVGRAFDVAGIPLEGTARWEGLPSTRHQRGDE